MTRHVGVWQWLTTWASEPGDGTVPTQGVVWFGIVAAVVVIGYGVSLSVASFRDRRDRAAMVYGPRRNRRTR